MKRLELKPWDRLCGFPSFSPSFHHLQPLVDIVRGQKFGIKFLSECIRIYIYNELVVLKKIDSSTATLMTGTPTTKFWTATGLGLLVGMARRARTLPGDKIA